MKKSETKLNIYEMVTNRIIEQLGKNIIPWRKPWTGSPDGAYNIITKKPYSLLNQMLLSKSGAYATFKQINDLGGKVKKGAKSEIVTFWKITPIEEIKEDGTKEIKQIPLLRHYNVFHIETQTEGIEVPTIELKELEPIEEAERVKEEYVTREQIEIKEVLTNQAFYSPSLDYIQVPKKEQYDNVNDFYATLFHEITHSTGHKKRLARLEEGTKLASFGSQYYSKEELTAELGSSMLLNKLRIETTQTFNNSTAYIRSWLFVLRNDNKMIISAASKAEKAVKYILGEDETEQ